MKPTAETARALRDSLSLTQLDFAALLGISQASVALVEAGRSPLPEKARATFARLSRGFPAGTATANALFAARNRLDLTPDQLAAALTLTPDAYEDIEEGDAPLPWHAALRLATLEEEAGHPVTFDGEAHGDTRDERAAIMEAPDIIYNEESPGWWAARTRLIRPAIAARNAASTPEAARLRALRKADLQSPARAARKARLEELEQVGGQAMVDWERYCYEQDQADEANATDPPLWGDEWRLHVESLGDAAYLACLEDALDDAPDGLTAAVARYEIASAVANHKNNRDNDRRSIAAEKQARATNRKLWEGDEAKHQAWLAKKAANPPPVFPTPEEWDTRRAEAAAMQAAHKEAGDKAFQKMLRKGQKNS